MDSTSTRTSYQLLLHALNHEDTQDNYERHVLVLEKWCRESVGGLYINDLASVVEVLRILQDRISLHPTLFTPVLELLLKNCSQPLLESKANERMRPSGLENIKALYAALPSLWRDSALETRMLCASCFRVIVNGGKDPSILRADQVEWKGDGNTVQVTDISFIQGLLRESGALFAIVNEFRKAVDELVVEKMKYMKISGALTKTQTNAASQSDGEDSDDERPIENADGGPGSETGSGYNSPNFGGEQMRSQSPDGSPTLDNEAETESNLLARKKERGDDLVALQGLVQVLLDLCLKLSTDPRNASYMCSLRIGDVAIKLLRVSASESARDPKVCLCVELLWNCLESYLFQGSGLEPVIESIQSDVLDFDVGVKCLRDVFLQLLTEGFRLADKDVRNDVVVLLTLLANFPGSIPHFLQSGLVVDLVTYACVGESGKNGWYFFSKPLAKFRHFVSAFDVDVLLKKELWMLISDILKYDDPDVIACVASSPLMAVMLHYLEMTLHVHGTSVAGSTANGGDTSSMSSGEQGTVKTGNFKTNATLSDALGRGSISGLGAMNGQTLTKMQITEGGQIDESLSKVAAPAQIRELQILAIIFLSGNAHRMMGEFVRIDGPARTLDIIIKYSSSNSASAEYRSIIFHSLVLLNRCLSSSNVVKEKLLERNGIDVFLRQFEFNEDKTIRAQAARVLSIMCTDSEASQSQLRKAKGIRILGSALTAYGVARRAELVSPASSTGDSDASGNGLGGGDLSILPVAVLDCLWSAVAGNRKNEARFAQVEGVDALLDVVEIAPLLVRVQALRLLGDLLNNFRLVAFALAWRSPKSMRSVGQLLAHMWREEELRLGTERDHGVICNVWDPLGPHRWPMDRNRVVSAGGGPSPTADGMGSQTSSTVSLIASSVVTKLNSAISQTRNGQTTSMPPELGDNMSMLDIRGIIANVLALLGLLRQYNNEEHRDSTEAQEMDEGSEDELSAGPREGPGKPMMGDDHPGKEPDVQRDESLTPADLQVIVNAARYGILREGQWWGQVVEELQMDGTVPVEADAYLVSQKLEEMFDAARSVQFEQMSLVDVDGAQRKAKEDVFMAQIIYQKNQELKSEWLKKKAQNAKVPMTTKVKLGTAARSAS